jgi:hypothetical protein
MRPKKAINRDRLSTRVVPEDPPSSDMSELQLGIRLPEGIGLPIPVDNCNSDRVGLVEPCPSDCDCEESGRAERPVEISSLIADLRADIEESSETRHVSGPTPVVSSGRSASAPSPLLGLSTETVDFLWSVAPDLVDKQYRLYTWNDTKTQGLITTNSVLFAVIGFLYADCLQDTLATVLLALGTCFVGVSLVVCLIHVIPRISSGKTGIEPNTRSLRGIGLYKKFEDYRDAFLLTTKTSILADTIRQIYGMADNNLRSARIIKRGVQLTLSGIALILCALYVSTLGARGHHAFGVWQINSTAGSVAQAPHSSTSPSQPSSTAPVLQPSDLQAPPTSIPPNPHISPNPLPKQHQLRNIP